MIYFYLAKGSEGELIMPLSLIWLIPVLPLLGSLINGVIGWRYEEHEKRKVITTIALLSTLLSLLLALWNIYYLMTFPFDNPPNLPTSVSIDKVHHSLTFTLGEWMNGGNFLTPSGGAGSFLINWSFVLDPLSAIMLFVVTFVGFLIHIYSVGYMAHDQGYFRYFSYLNLFMAMMLTLILGGNYLMMFVGWEGVGLCSYLLIGFYYNKDYCADAGKKAFLTNRIGDVGFSIGLILILYYFGTLDISKVNEIAVSGGMVPSYIITASAILLFVGATGKSAQIPLYVWLPDAMAGPTPVSALIHAATMVTSGVYLVARSNGLYSSSPTALMVVAIIGCLTAIFAASIGLVQNDIKKVLAYSTVSQLGYMFLGVGVGAYASGIFHLYTHAFFKALLFLGAGSVIHALSGEQDIRKMGQLFNKIPNTAKTFMIGCITIAGIPPLAGFFSKDEILWQALNSDKGVGKFSPFLAQTLFFVGVITAFMTAFYMFRLFYLTFFNTDRVEESAREHIHESPKVMTTPLWILAICSTIAGFVGMPKVWVGSEGNLWENFLKTTIYKEVEEGNLSHSLEWGAMILSVCIALLGIYVAMKFYKNENKTPEKISTKIKSVYTLLLNKYYVDEIYSLIVIKPFLKLSEIFFLFDKYIIDGAVNLSAHISEISGHLLRLFQTGYIRNYALYFFLALIVMIYFVVF